LASGVRLENAVGLKWQWVNFQSRVISYPAGTTKAKTALSVPITEAIERLLRGEKGKHLVHVFTHGGEPIASPKKGFKAACRRAGLPNVSFHWLRHSWASWHAMNGTPPDVLQALGGWATPKIVQRYAHLSPSYVAGYAANATPPMIEKERKRK
jgi:integrase